MMTNHHRRRTTSEGERAESYSPERTNGSLAMRISRWLEKHSRELFNSNKETPERKGLAKGRADKERHGEGLFSCAPFVAC